MKILKKFRPDLLFVCFSFLIVVLWIGYSWYIKNQNDDEQAMARLSKMIELPAEIPTIATVTDREKLADQPFFQKAENGDKIVIYVEARRAYLYRPAEGKIIDMTVVTRETQEPSSTMEKENIPVFQHKNE